MPEKKHQIIIDPTDDRTILDFRDVGFEDVLCLGRYRYHTAKSPLSIHSHGDLIELAYIHSGKQAYVVEGQEYHLSGGDFFFVWPNEMHGTGNSPEEPGMLYFIILQKPEEGQRFLSLAPQESQLLWQQFEDLPARQFYGGSRFRVILDKIFLAYDQLNNPLRIVETRNLLLRFLLDTLTASGDMSSHLTPEIHKTVDLINGSREYIPELSELANLAGLSLSRFKARFKEEMGIAPGDYIMRTKVEAASNILIQDNTSITNIALFLGFSTSQYFSTVFRKYMGVTPTEYRKSKTATHI